MFTRPTGPRMQIRQNEASKIRSLCPVVTSIARLRFDLAALRSAFSDFVSKHPFTEKNQILLNSQNPNHFDPREGLGSLYCAQNNPSGFKEFDFKYFNPSLEGTYFDQIYRSVLSFWPGQVGRIRLMKLPPKTCYSVHVDDGYRLHLPIFTSGQCFLCFPEEGMFHLPANGLAYFTNTLKEHSAMNGSQIDRIHLVFSLSRLNPLSIFDEDRALQAFYEDSLKTF